MHRWAGHAWPITCRTFFGERMNLLLPSALDIALTGGKTHDSEIRLARFLIERLQPGEQVVDVGAHYGYFSMLAARLVGSDGRVLALEATPQTHAVLAGNAARCTGMEAVHVAVHDSMMPADLTIHSNRAAEWNSINPSVREGCDVRTERVPGTSLDAVVRAHTLTPSLVKLDVEGAEDRVVAGGVEVLDRGVTVVMEHAAPGMDDASHQRAVERMRDMGYRPFAIRADGSLDAIRDVSSHVSHTGLESDNVVFERD